MMNSHKELFSHLRRLFLPFLLLLGQIGLQGEACLQCHSSEKLFVFGDSYVDTGNTNKEYPGSWKDPYGMTYPGLPSGRFSDGRVLTDYIADYLGLKSPIPYQLRNEVSSYYLKYGMNFACGGTGLFTGNPNMTTQIDFFKQLIEENVYNASDLNNSLALLSALGNDYFDYLTYGSIWGFKSFVDSLVNQMTTNLIRIQKLGVKKILVTSLPPFGCIPAVSSFNPLKRCLNIINIIPIAHNKLLNQSIIKLNQETSDGTTFVFLDLYDSFMSVINDPSTNNITEYYTACCLGVSSKYVCGSVDENNEKQYKVCENPESTMFWDPIHPTQAGWHAVYNNLQMDDLGQLQC